MDHYEQFESKFEFPLPESYRKLHARGCFDPRAFKPDNPLNSTYLWIPVVEWWSFESILSYQVPKYHLPGFIPFANSEAGDLWCWVPAHSNGKQVPIAFCPNDYRLASLDAPDFSGWLFRRTFTYSLAPIEPDEVENRRLWFERWVADLSTLLKPRWRIKLQEVSSLPLKSCQEAEKEIHFLVSSEEYLETIRREIRFPGLDQEIPWMV